MLTQVGTEWTPTPQQARFLEAACEAGLSRNLSAIAKAASVPRRTVYNWIDSDPDFRKSWGDLWKTALSNHMPGIVSAMVTRALSGNVPAARLVLKMAGNINTQNGATLEGVINEAGRIRDSSSSRGGPAPH